ncbi:MAG: HAMP domain-containing histidine kinase [Faecalibacterium sp.]|jgi:signal transduction histidine kinase|nr:HAMP domain-containing histidine kinase [Faecalibacterium sp.]
MNSRWGRFTRSTKGKAVGWLGGILACFFGALCCAVILGAMDMGCYDAGVTSYYDTYGCSRVVRGYACDAWDWYAGRDGKGAQYVLSDDFTFLLKDGKTGNKLYSNVDDTKAHFIGRLCIFQDQQGERINYVWVGPQEDTTYLADSTATTSTRETVMDCYLPDFDQVQEKALLTRISLFDFVFAARYAAIAGVAFCAVLGIFSAVVLLCGAGRRLGDDEVHLCWYDRIPMELSALGTAGLMLTPAILGYGLPRLLYALGGGYSETGLTVLGAIFGASAISLLATGLVLCFGAWLLSFARWAKTGHAFQNFVCVRLLKGVVHALTYSFGALPLVKKTAAAVGAVALGNLVAYFLFAMLGSVYRWGAAGTQFLFLFGIAAWAAVWYLCLRIARNLQTLRQATQRIAAGDYATPVDARELLPVFYEDADCLSHIGAGMNDAVATRIKSERLKAELITNVSHDLKTPLTSIINYTDLLLREPLPEKAAEYAAVLARQGEKLKKLTEDLIDASKASSGAMPCHKAKGSLSELCEQALGEYEEKLKNAKLEAVLSLPENGLDAIFDGRLTWRVLDNLLSNACKYAMPGTRLYLTGERRGKAAVLSVKNISATPLNISPDELMERFVRGDRSRTMEGSGLGLSIARSLTELQGGTFTLTVDGDLFKAELSFPEDTAPTAAPMQ